MKYTYLRNLIRTLIAAAAVLGGASLMSACADEGPLEETGEAIDDAADEIDEEL